MNFPIIAHTPFIVMLCTAPLFQSYFAVVRLSLYVSSSCISHSFFPSFLLPSSHFHSAFFSYSPSLNFFSRFSFSFSIPPFHPSTFQFPPFPIVLLTHPFSTIHSPVALPGPEKDQKLTHSPGGERLSNIIVFWAAAILAPPGRTEP